MTKDCPVCGSPTRRDRSLNDHRRLFGLINAAFQHWPETHEFRPENTEHLRAWLLCKARHCNVVSIPVPSTDPAIIRLALLSAEAALAASENRAFVRPGNAGISVFTPKSLAFSELDQSAFRHVREAVETVIEHEIGVSADELLRQTERAA